MLRMSSISIRSIDDQSPTVSTGMPVGRPCTPRTAAFAATSIMDMSAQVCARIEEPRLGL